MRVESATDPRHFAFQPDPERTHEVDRRVRASYADSIRSLLDAFAAQGVVPAGSPAAVSAAVRDGRPSPGLIAAYADLVEAVFADRREDAAAALEALLACADRPLGEEPAFVTLDDGILGPGQSRRYLQLLDDDPDSPLDVTRLPQDELAESEAVARAAFRLLDEAAPELGGEVRCLIREMLLAKAAPGSSSDFHGASAYLLWGGLMINGPYHRSRVAMAEALAHETGHSLLFGLNFGVPLTENDRAQRYSSPLREDPRPMEGIVHATYVCARMHYCLSRLIESGLLSADEQAEAVEAKEARRRAFAQGIELVERHAAFSEAGRAIFEPAVAYMNMRGNAAA